MAPCTVTAGRPKCATTWLLTVWAAFAVSACRASVAYRLLLATPLWSELRFISSLVLLHMAPGCRCRQSPTGCDRCLINLQPGACRAFQFCAGHGCPVRVGIAMVCVAHAWCHFGHRPSHVLHCLSVATCSHMPLLCVTASSCHRCIVTTSTSSRHRCVCCPFTRLLFVHLYTGSTWPPLF